MWVNFSDIPDNGLRLELRESPQDIQLEIDEIRVSGHLEFKGRLDRLEKDVIVRGNLNTTVDVVCARCLENFQLPVSSPVEVEYRLRVERPQEEEIELIEEDADVYYYTQDRLNLEEALRDQILLAVLLKPLCLTDCKGLCPGCGANLNQGACGCPQENVDPRLEALKAFRRGREE